jgi:hypothetical protein
MLYIAVAAPMPNPSVISAAFAGWTTSALTLTMARVSFDEVQRSLSPR